MLIERGLLMSKGTLVDATQMASPSSTKNRERARDPEMHQVKQASSATPQFAGYAEWVGGEGRDPKSGISSSFP